MSLSFTLTKYLRISVAPTFALYFLFWWMIISAKRKNRESACGCWMLIVRFGLIRLIPTLNWLALRLFVSVHSIAHSKGNGLEEEKERQRGVDRLDVLLQVVSSHSAPPENRKKKKRKKRSNP
jgi:hypothetical protein